MTPEEAQKALEESRRLKLDDAYRKVIASEEGREVLWDLINNRSGVFRECFRQEDTHRTAYLEGVRSVGLGLVADVQRLSPSDWLHMLSEAASRTERLRLERQQQLDEKERSDGG